MKLCVALLALWVACASAYSRFRGQEKPGEVSYKGDFLLNVEVRTPSQMAALQALYENPELNIDFWTELKRGPVEVVVPRGSLDAFHRLALRYEILAEDLQDAIDERNIRRLLKNVNVERNDSFFSEYHDLDEIKQWLDDLIAKYPTLATKVVIGTSYLGEEIEGLRIRGANANPGKAIVYHGGQHSNEWIGVAVASYVLYELLDGYGRDSTVTNLMNNIEWTIIPVLNVDGYRYTWTTNSGWRKNRQPNAGSTCIGIDNNRNWPYRWNNGGSSSDPCASNYHGPAPFFSPEPMRVYNYIESLQIEGKEVISYIDYHCCGLMWMSPWGYTCNDVPNDDVIQKEAGQIAVDAVRAVYGVSYAMGNICEVIYQASGSSADSTYGELNVTWSFALELRGSSQFNPSLIIPNGEEIWAGVKAYTSTLI